jgi:hypothetical protein
MTALVSDVVNGICAMNGLEMAPQVILGAEAFARAHAFRVLASERLLMPIDVLAM